MFYKNDILMLLRFMNDVSNVSEPSSRDPMVESTSSSGSSSDTNEPVCAQLLTQLNTAYQHLAPDAQALVSVTNRVLYFLRLFMNEMTFYDWRII